MFAQTDEHTYMNLFTGYPVHFAAGTTSARVYVARHQYLTLEGIDAVRLRIAIDRTLPFRAKLAFTFTREKGGTPCPPCPR